MTFCSIVCTLINWGDLSCTGTGDSCAHGTGSLGIDPVFPVLMFVLDDSCASDSDAVGYATRSMGLNAELG